MAFGREPETMTISSNSLHTEWSIMVLKSTNDGSSDAKGVGHHLSIGDPTN